MRRLGPALLALAAVLAGTAPAAAQGAVQAALDSAEIQNRIAQLRSSIRPRNGGVLGLMGYNVIPDGSTNSLQLNSTSVGGEADPTLTLSQFGMGFTLSESFPLFLEGYLGTARYDPLYAFSGGTEDRKSRMRWNNVAGTIGVGYDFKLAEYLFLRPILNVSLGTAAADAALLGWFVNWRTGRDISPLTDAHVNVYGLGGSLMLAYYDYRPERDIDVELRYTQIQLQTFGDTIPQARGSSTAKTVTLWTRYRWPTGWEAFGRPMRWVIDNSFSWYLGDQAQTIGFGWAMKLGGGVEVDIGRYEIGAVGLTLSRLRLIGRYFIGENNVTGFSAGIGMSF